MDIGVFSFNTHYGIDPATLARALEARGFDSLWIGEHSHIPVSRRTPYPAGGELPRQYSHMMDPFVSLMAAGAATTRLKLATGVCLVIERDPLMLAKEIATLDQLTGGRFLFGIGGGWNAEEMENHGTAFDTRWRVLKERVEAMKVLWTEEEPSYHGEFVDFDPVWSFPKPVQQPHPPVIFGGGTALGRKRVADYCDGWAPIDLLVGDVPAALDDLKARCEAAGRDPASIEVSMWCWEAPDEARLQHYRALGIARVVLFLPVDDRAAEMPFLDRYAALIPKLA
ncbi:MAG: LLM class F420-dependent oxidoreductase [Gammaproteobacteria bacterium]|nr:LLM class F420-dependent oxidoreductase [Gammaproteobacteria bacterium]